jgi:hypothetical protein
MKGATDNEKDKKVAIEKDVEKKRENTQKDEENKPDFTKKSIYIVKKTKNPD